MILDQEEQTFIRALSAQRYYNEAKNIRIQILQGNQKIMNMVQHDLARILRDRVATPTQKLLAMRFAKDSLETFNDAYISQFQETVLPIIEKIALFQKESKDHDRGKFYFSDKPIGEIRLLGNSFIRLTLENLWVWSKWFPIDPDTQTVSPYKVCLMRLMNQGVTFPKIEYYDFSFVVKHTPDMQVPIILLKQCKAIIKEDLKKTKGNGSNLKIICDQMSYDIRTEMKKIDKKDVFYSQIIHRMYKKILKEKHGSDHDQSQSEPSQKIMKQRFTVVEFDDEASPKSAKSQNQKNLGQLQKEFKLMKSELMKVMDDNEEMKHTIGFLVSQMTPIQTQQQFFIASRAISEIKISDIKPENMPTPMPTPPSQILKSLIQSPQMIDFKTTQRGFRNQITPINTQIVETQSRESFLSSQNPTFTFKKDPRKSEFQQSMDQQDRMAKTIQQMNTRKQQALLSIQLIQSSRMRSSQK